MRRSDKDFDGVPTVPRIVDPEDATQADPNGARFAGLLSRLQDLVGDADVDVDAPIEDENARGRP